MEVGGGGAAILYIFLHIVKLNKGIGGCRNSKIVSDLRCVLAKVGIAT